MHIVPQSHLVGTDDRRVVLRLACRYTRHATDAGGEIDAHAPSLFGFVPGRQQCRLILRSGRRTGPAIEVDLTQQVAPLGRVELLGGDDADPVSGPGDGNRTCRADETEDIYSNGRLIT